MKKILIGLTLFVLTVSVKAQVQYGGVIRAVNNSNVIGQIQRTGDNLKVTDSTNKVVLSSIDSKITAVNTGAVVISSSALPSLASTSTKQSDGSQKTQIVDASNNVIGATSNALDINIKSGNPTSITANAGSNLNTSLLALESGGNMASIKTNTDNLILAQASTTSGQTGNLILGAATTAAPTYTTAKSYPLSLTTAGALRVDNTGNTQPVSFSGQSVTVTQATGTNLHAVLDANSGVDIGKLTANQSVNVSQINGVTPLMGTGIMGTGSPRVTIASDNDPLTVKQATAANLNATVVGTGTFTVQPASGTAPVVTMNSASANSGLNSALAGVFDDVSPTAITENSFGFLRMSTNRNLYNTIRDAAGNERGANVTASNELLVNVNSALPTGSNTIGAVNIAAAQTLATVTTVSTVTNLSQLGGTAIAMNTGVRAAGVQRVTIATDDIVPASQSGTWTVQPGNTANTTPWLVAGAAASGASVSGNPLNIGAKGVTAEQTAVTNGQEVNLVTDIVGKLITMPYANPENFVSGAITSAMTGTTSTSLIAAPAAGLRNYITTIVVSNSHATVGTDIIIQDGSGGTTLMTIPASAVYGGAVINLPVPLRQPTTATAIFCANVTTGASTKVSAVGYIGK